jgi:hypothetical protein
VNHRIFERKLRSRGYPPGARSLECRFYTSLFYSPLHYIYIYIYIYIWSGERVLLRVCVCVCAYNNAHIYIIICSMALDCV